MKTQTANQTSNKVKVILLMTLLGLLTACGNSKSANPVTQSSFDINSQKPYAQCNKSKDANMSFNSMSVMDQSGQVSTEWIKLKFNFLSAQMTASGNVIKFFRWRVSGAQAVLDETPLQVAAYNFSTGQTASSPSNQLDASQVNGQYGYYVKINDPTLMFQVLKVVIYDSKGAVIGNLNSLIPEFFASPEDYKYNIDGSARSVSLQQMHALYGVNVTGKSAAELKAQFDQYCF